MGQGGPRDVANNLKKITVIFGSFSLTRSRVKAQRQYFAPATGSYLIIAFPPNPAYLFHSPTFDFNGSESGSPKG